MIPSMRTAREVELVNTFVIANKRERYVGFVSSSKRRSKFVEALYHFSDVDPACVREPSDPRGLLAELRASVPAKAATSCPRAVSWTA